jgi:RHS repeat-associated protein
MPSRSGAPLHTATPMANHGIRRHSAALGEYGPRFLNGRQRSVTPTTGQAQTLTYDQANRLTKYAAASTTSYGYNGDGLRMCKVAGSSTQPCQAGGNTQFLWDVAGSLPLLLKDGTTSYIYGPGGLPLEQVNTGATYWYHHDQIGSTRLVTNSSGGTAATYTFDPYGGLAASTNPGGITNPFGFCGQYQDSESGFYYLRARYYDPATAQFNAVDRALGTTRSPYGYVANNPLNAADPSGLCRSDDWGCLFRSTVHSAYTVVTNPEARKQFVAAVAKSYQLNILSVVSVVPYAMYYGAYIFNQNVAPHFPDNFGIRQFATATMCGLQHTGLGWDESLDRYQAQQGYPDPTNPPENDEDITVHKLPSIIYPEWTGSCWQQSKFNYGPTTHGPGRGPSGHEDYAC